MTCCTVVEVSDESGDKVNYKYKKRLFMEEFKHLVLIFSFFTKHAIIFIKRLIYQCYKCVSYNE